MSAFSFKYFTTAGKPLLKINAWILMVGAIAAIIATPIVIVMSSFFAYAGSTWQHLIATVLPGYIINSLILSVGVGIGVFAMGTINAWLVTMCRFRGCKTFEWSLLLPLAAPAYLLAYIYTELLEYYGPVQRGLRQLFGWQTIQDYWFPNIRSMGGAIAMLILVLYPYVYLLARVAFLEQGACTLEASRSLGCNPWQSFRKVALPLARPAITVGVSLALMEALSDFGTVDFFGIPTFTVGIYRWFAQGGEYQIGSYQMAACLLIFVFALIILERQSRRQAQYYQNSSNQQTLSTYHLTGWRGILASLSCFIPILLGFLLPIGILLHMTITNADKTLGSNFWQLSQHSLILASVTAVLAVILALVMAYGQRLTPNSIMGFLTRTAAMGYAVPGTVVAVAILPVAGRVDNWIDGLMRSLFGFSTGLLLSGTIAALIFAYLVRFLTVSFNTVESSLGKIKPSLDDAARSLGYNPRRTLIKVHAPLMSGGLLTAAMLVFVDVMKELPATYAIRPFNFDTLAVQVYRYAADERLIEASAPALAIIVVGLIPTIFLSWRIARSRPSL